MLSLFQPSTPAVAQTADTVSMVPLSVVRSVLEEIATERKKNLEFRDAVTAHEQANSHPSTTTETSASAPRKKITQSSSAARGGSGSMQPGNKRDLKIRPPNNKNVPRKIPRSISNQVVWDVVKYDATINAINGAPSEYNVAPGLNAHPQNTSWRTLFDQWCIPQFSVSYYSLQPPGDTNAPASLYTALDFDSTTPLVTVQAIEDFSTCAVNVMVPQKTFVRSVTPTIKMDAPTSTGAYVGRQWVDSAAPTTLWYGIRALLNSTAAVQQYVKITVTIVFAFRNQI